MLSLKPGVNPYNIQPGLLLGISVVVAAFAKHGHDCEITRLYDWTSLQVNRSLHNRDGLCRAADFKTRHLPEYTRDLLLGELKEAFGYASQAPRAFDFIFEQRITSPDGRLVKEQHFHLELDLEGRFPPPLAAPIV